MGEELLNFPYYILLSLNADSTLSAPKGKPYKSQQISKSILFY